MVQWLVNNRSQLLYFCSNAGTPSTSDQLYAHNRRQIGNNKNESSICIVNYYMANQHQQMAVYL